MKMYKVHLKNDKFCSELFETPTAALKKYGAANIKKLEEVFSKEPIKAKPTSSEIVLEISARSLDDLKVSEAAGYTVTYNKPADDKVFEGMKMIETSDEYVLEATMGSIVKYDKLIHSEWKGPGYRPEKEWEWAIYHKNATMITKKEALKKYGKFAGIQGGIGYINSK
jgi:hypothetical protein